MLLKLIDLHAYSIKPLIIVLISYTNTSSSSSPVPLITMYLTYMLISSTPITQYLEALLLVKNTSFL